MILVSDRDSKRSVYFQKAAVEVQLPVRQIEWEQLEACAIAGEFERAVVKIDPPSYHTASVKEMNAHIEDYKRKMQLLFGTDGRFLNRPEALMQAFDKRKAKRLLAKADVAVTPVVLEYPENLEQLFDVMQGKHVYSVFIKPVCYSGAAGVVAFRWNPVNGGMRVYTSCVVENDVLMNTKKMWCLKDRHDIEALLCKLLSMDTIVERWMPKAEIQGKIFDLRVVYQFGEIDCIAVRGSNGPITNLHLNNMLLSADLLALKEENLEEIRRLCKRAMSVFAGLQSAGFDILLEKGTNRPFLIEVNGQGDLLYQDIYGENAIYRRQAKWMLQQEREPGGKSCD